MLLQVTTVVVVNDPTRVILPSTTTAAGVPDDHLQTKVSTRLLDPLFNGRFHVHVNPARFVRPPNSQ